MFDPKNENVNLDVETEPELKKYGKEEKHLCLICDTGYRTKMDLMIHIASEHDMKYECFECFKLFESDFALDEHTSYVHGADAKPIFECPTCKNEFKEEVSLAEHVNLIHSKMKKCNFPFCNREYGKIRELNRHITNVHKTKDYLKKIPCEVCGEMKTRELMERHMTSCRAKLENPVHPCPACGKIYKTKSLLAVHIRVIHSCTRCTVCNLEVKNGYPFMKHMALKHDGEIFMCSNCGNEYYSEKRLKDHVEVEHEMKNFCVCSLCGKSFKLEKRLKKHIKEVHEGKKQTYTCQKCPDFVCKNLITLRKHNERVHEGKLYYCSQCPENFNSVTKLKGHVAFVHDRSQLFPCTTCKKEYISERALKEHIEFAHEKTRGFACNVCAHISKDPSMLKSHIKNVHEEKVRHQCEICSKTYSKPFDLKKHVKLVHDGKDTSEKCPICNKPVSCQSVLKKHIKLAHEKKQPHEYDSWGNKNL